MAFRSNSCICSAVATFIISPFQYDMGHGAGSVVGKGDKCPLNPVGLEELLCLSAEGEMRFPRGVVLHFDIRPLNSIPQSGSDRLKKGLFGRKKDGKTFSRSGPSLAPEDLLLRKYPAKEEISPAGHHVFNPLDIHNVNAGTKDHIPIADFRLQIADLKSEILNLKSK